jgi:hypothetical protein
MFLLVFVSWTDNTTSKINMQETWTGNTTTKRNMDRKYNDQKKHEQAIQLPKETWTGNTTTKRNMDWQYNDQKKHGQVFLLVVILSVHISFRSCIVCPCFFWSLYCLSMFLLVVVLGNTMTKRNIVEKYNDQKKHGQTIQRPKEARRDNTTTKRNMDRQYNDQKKHGQAIQLPKETWTDNTTTKRNMELPVHVSLGRCIVSPCFLWSLYCLSMFLLVVVFFDNVSFDHCIACPCFCWSLYKRNTQET